MRDPGDPAFEVPDNRQKALCWMPQSLENGVRAGADATTYATNTGVTFSIRITFNTCMRTRRALLKKKMSTESTSHVNPPKPFPKHNHSTTSASSLGLSAPLGTGGVAVVF